MTQMNGPIRITRRGLLAVAVATAYSHNAFAQDAPLEQPPAVTNFAQALQQGDATVNFRARSETVDIEGSDSVDLLSLKTRLTLSSAEYQGFSVLLEMDDVTHVTEFEGGIADPEGTEVNQYMLAYSKGSTTLKYGRQRILLDNQRFVGGVGFRQNEQTYDGFSLSNTSLEDTTVFLAHIDNVNRIFGEDSPLGDHENDTYLFNARYEGFSVGALSAYAYLIDNETAPLFSTDTYGLRFAGAAGNLGYQLEYATQTEAGDSPASYSADYVLVDAGYKLGPVRLAAGYELLGADGSDGQFITPLATLHKFQGWNDKFLGGGTGNIPGGIEDTYLSVGTTLAGVKLAVNYHQLGSDDPDVSGMDKLGSEYGFLVAGKLGVVGMSLKYSQYQADEFSVDTDKLWLTAQAEF
ncbi:MULTISPECIES: alginate export family protein [unclassified Microbulbifer]|uniref:alginate export family protein n=1 Tax=unclassified Microbulbifer TaxID=2619833 RepID=UPI001E34993E|nr:alginate export family protein [Microbulbifer sp. YPW16]UHQ56212.1 alginate export family protein [Microbulbifer sp. YPW16]